MKVCGRLFLTCLASVASACAVAEPEISKLALFSPYEVTLTQDAVERTELRLPPTCGRLFVKGDFEALDEKDSKSTTLTALLTESCDDPWAFRLNKSYVIVYETTGANDNQIVNAAEVILWDDEGVHVLKESWLVSALPVTFESIRCASIQLGPFPGMTDFDNKECIRFNVVEFLSRTAIVGNAN